MATPTCRSWRSIRKGSSLIGVNSLFLHDSRACAKMLATMGEGFEAGKLPKPILREWAFADGIAAYREVDKGAREKIVLTQMAG